jgi:MerR family transcriptional regulator, mercuric resistance operon regulatory protein
LEKLTTTKVAGIVGVNTETLRYYERIGLAPKPPRSQGGHRLYSAKDIEQLKFIRHARSLGFSLEEIRVLLGMRDPAHRLEVRAIAADRLKKLEAELEEKKRAAELLSKAIAECETHGCGCQIMDMLAADANFDASARSR